MLNPIYPAKTLHPTETALLNTALSQLLITGIEPLSITHLVQVSGLSRSVFYHHFSSKDDLLSGLLLADEMGLAEVIKPEIATNSLKGILKSYLKYRLQDIDKYRLIISIEQRLMAVDPAPKRWSDWQRLRKIHADQIRAAAAQNGAHRSNQDQDRLDYYFGLVWALANGVASISNTDAYAQVIRDRRGFSRFLLELLEAWPEEGI
ncbi:MAG: TetR/AcrR family transcriptional regulator [Saccharospirillum sp.]